MKRIAISVLTITVVALVGFAVTRAFFSDTETSTGNTITAGSIDISVDDENPWIAQFPDEITDMKPSYVRWTRHVVKNVGTNPVKLWKHIKDVETSENQISESEQDWYDQHPDELDSGEKNNIDEFIEYDMYIGGTVEGDGVTPENNWFGGHNVNGQVIIDEDDGITVADINSLFVYLGEVAPGDEIVVWQSYHMKDETGNWAQTDTLSYTIEFYAEQVNGTGPSANTLLLENKNYATDWSSILGDGMWGILKWAGDGDTFDFSSTLEAHGLQAGTNYSLIYYADPWPGNNPGALLGTGTSNASGDLTIANDLDLGIDLPDPADANYPGGAKIWLVPSSDWPFPGGGWNPENYLFETNLIQYDDTNN